MDDDPEPSLDPVILRSRETSEHVLNIGELQKCNLESNDENGIHQESGDNGPFLETEATKKAISAKDTPDPALQVDSKTSIFRSKELMDSSQPPDVSGSLKSSTTSLRKPPRRNVQRLPGQESRRSSQQSTIPQTLLSQKSPRTQSINEPDAKDITWVSQRTGKIMKCRSQQTSLIWERKVLSEILQTSSEESDRSKDEETDEVTSSGEMASTEEASGREMLSSNQQQEEKRSKRNSQQLDSRRSSQRSAMGPILLMQKGMGAEEEMSWISQRTGREMKNKAQQTSIIWELKTLSEILRHSSQESLCNIETDTTECEDAFVSSAEAEGEQPTAQKVCHRIQQPETKPERGPESRRGSQHLEAKSLRPESQQPEEPKPEPPRKSQGQKFDQAQQTDSTESLRRELIDYSQQMDDSKMGLTTEQKGSHHGSQNLEAKPPRPELQQPEGPKPEPPRKRQVQKLDQAEKMGSTESLKRELLKCSQRTDGSETGLIEDTWISRKTGKVVKNQSQQTDKSWLQYCATKMQKIKKCSSQQTDESFLQRFSTIKVSSGDSLASRGPTADLSSVCANEDTTELYFSDVQLSPVASQSDTGMAQMAEETEPPTGRGEERGEWQGAEEEKMVDKPTDSDIQWPGDPEIKSTTASVSSFVEGEDIAQQTYSIISLEDGIWMNRRTGKLLVSHTQQTSQTVIPVVLSLTALRKVGSVEWEACRPSGRVDLEPQEEGETQPAEDRDRQQPLQKGSCSSNQEQDAHLIVVQTAVGGSQCADDVEKLLSRRLSEAMLLSVEAPDGEDETEPLYTAVEEGSWVNVKTGRLLASQKQQTEESAGQFLADEEQQPRAAVQQSPEEGQVGHPALNGDLRKEPAEEGMDDDPSDRSQILD